MPDDWEAAHQLNADDPDDAALDSDKDGFTNLQEYLAGTDPNSSTSALRITAITREGDDIRVTWMTAAGKTNALQRRENLLVIPVPIFTVTNTVGTTTNYLDVGAATNAPAFFYRVRLVP